MKVFNVKTKRRETFDPAKHVGMFICLWQHRQALVCKLLGRSKIIGLGWSKDHERNLLFLFPKTGEVMSCNWDSTCYPKVFESEEECDKLRVSINLEHTEWKDSLTNDS